MSLPPIGQIGTIRMGVTLRGRDATRPDPHGSCRMIRISDLRDDGLIDSHDLLQFEPGEPLKPEHFLRPGDVLFPNRGLRTTAAVFDLPDRNVLVGAQFFVIRVNSNAVLPSYVAWYLRSEVAAAHFSERRKGTTVQTLQRGDVEALTIPLPPLPRQHVIVELDHLAREERRLSSEIIRLRSLLVQRLLVHTAHPS